MGQYFFPYLKDKDGKEIFVDQSEKFFDLKKKNEENPGSDEYPNAYDYYIGVKLMEHSWVNNSLTNAVASKLYNNPQTLAWIGDYSEKADLLENVEFVPYSEAEGEFNVKDKVCLNHTKKEYFSFSDLPVEHNYHNRKYFIYPLSLLTSMGNGNGGGDYHGTADIKKVGSWAMDIIEISDTVPDGYKDIRPKFTERDR